MTEKTFGFGYVDTSREETTLIITLKVDKNNTVLISYKAIGANNTSSGKSLAKFMKTPLQTNYDFLRLHDLWERCNEKSLIDISPVDRFAIKKMLT